MCVGECGKKDMAPMRIAKKTPNTAADHARPKFAGPVAMSQRKDGKKRNTLERWNKKKKPASKSRLNAASHDDTTTASGSASATSTDAGASAVGTAVFFVCVHHLSLAGAAATSACAGATGTGFFLGDHEFGPFALEACGGRKVAPQHALGVLFDRGLVVVEALELDDLCRVGADGLRLRRCRRDARVIRG